MRREVGIIEAAKGARKLLGTVLYITFHFLSRMLYSAFAILLQPIR
jgi:hypothetical protein